MDSEPKAREPLEFTSHSTLQHAGSASGFFSGCHHFTVVGGTFTQITYNQIINAPTTTPVNGDIFPQDDEEEWQRDIARAPIEDIEALEARVRMLKHHQIRPRRTSDMARVNLQSTAHMVHRAAINAQDTSCGNSASLTTDISNSCEDRSSCTGSIVLALTSGLAHAIRLVPLQAPSFIQPIVCELEEGLSSPLWIGCPQNGEPHSRVAYRERIAQCHGELYVIPGPRFFLRDPTGRGICLNGRNLATENTPSDLHAIKDGDIIQLNIRYCDRLGVTHRATQLKFEIFPPQYMNSVHSAATTTSPTRADIPEALNATNGCTLIQLTDVLDPPSFTAVLCQLLDGARPVQLRRSSDRNTSPAITFDSKTVSRRHATLWSEHGQVFIIDRHSTHGTYLNSDKLVQGRTLENAEVLTDGDILGIGVADDRPAIRGITAKLRILRIAR
ncbi:SMAD/FHA domain-containing protein [Mycena venus]|uniref:SMAD/FHA domain-containing protein n=1 Tax=Mycena venus TaxID=2733690 RepID=A0A8H7CGJ0_9AGAR|nr:SMAD/FHA domain-containing protein [Mycena venus]